ncbi:MAG: pyridoxal kinase [Porticoccaceae bacterium]|nr:pyridoxal kinase [Porticoccaceae bacterium]
MARVLALSSHVAFGTVGLAVTVRALHALGHEVIALPTIVLSNHPGYPHVAGNKIPAVDLEKMLDALEANGWLRGTDCVLAGYLPTPSHVVIACSAVRMVRARNASALIVCDPIFGDDPEGLYIDGATAAALRQQLLPICDLATPNRFELSWLTDETVTTPQTAVDAARSLRVPTVLATSIPASDDRLATLRIAQNGACGCFVPRRRAAPHGTGDLLAALYLGHTLNGADPDTALGAAVADVEMAIGTSEGRDELSLSGGTVMGRAKPLPTVRI